MSVFIERSKQGLQNLNTELKLRLDSVGSHRLFRSIKLAGDSEGDVISFGQSTLERTDSGWLCTGSGRTQDDLLASLRLYLNSISLALPEIAPKAPPPKNSEIQNIF